MLRSDLDRCSESPRDAKLSTTHQQTHRLFLSTVIWGLRQTPRHPRREWSGKVEGSRLLVLCLLSHLLRLKHSSTVSLGLWSPKCRAWQGALAGFASRGRAQPFPLLSLATDSRSRTWEGLDNSGRCQQGGGGTSTGAQSLVSLFCLTFYLEEAREIIQKL